MHILKLFLIVILSIAVIGPAHARNTTPRGYMNSAAKSLGNNSDVTTKSGRKAWSQKSRIHAEDYVRNEYKQNRKEPRWKQQQRARMKKHSKATSGVNE
jgi:hypothetical protein